MFTNSIINKMQYIPIMEYNTATRKNYCYMKHKSHKDKSEQKKSYLKE